MAALGNVKEITVYINSGGGDVFAAQTIGNMLERNGATVIAHIDGLCASAATKALRKLAIAASSATHTGIDFFMQMPIGDFLDTCKDIQEMQEQWRKAMH